MDLGTFIAALVTIGGGALSHRITNALAIAMLFRPHEPVKVGPFSFQGAIPKNKARLAKSVAKTVGERLLTADDLTKQLGTPAIRSAFTESIERALRSALARDYGSVRTELGPAAITTLEELAGQLGQRLAAAIASYAASPDFDLLVADWHRQLRERLGERPVGDVLTPARREAVTRLVGEWVQSVTGGAGLEGTLRGWVAEQLQKLEEDDRPLIDRLPPGLLTPIEQAIADALPAALDKLGDMLSDPEAKSTIRLALREAFDGAARAMLIHERLLAKLVVNDKTLERLVDGFEKEGFDRLAAAVTTPEMRARVATAVHDGLESLLTEPLGARLKRLTADRHAALEAVLSDWLISAARSDSTKAALSQGLEQVLDAAGRLTWDRLLASLPPEQIALFLREAIAGRRGQQWLETTAATVSIGLLDRPIGRPGNLVKTDQTARLAAAASDTAWTWVQAELPTVIGRLNVPEMVEQKIMGFSTQLLEDIIRKVAERELKLIIRLGWLLGGIVGLMTFLINQLATRLH
ncbi:MAG: DUF445 family protein [Gemmatimonadota bacterium]